MSRLQDVLQSGARADQPLATAVPTGSLYYVTDESVIEQSDGSAWSAYSGTGGGGIPVTNVQRSYRVSGGEIAWSANYVFDVAACFYVIDGVSYQSAADQVTLSAADVTNDRIDVIVVDNAGAVVVVEGTAAAQPVEPDIDPGTQVKLGFVLVEASTTQPSTASTELLYAENVGAATEWNWATSDASMVLASTNDARNGTKSIEGTNVVSGAYLTATRGSGSVDPAAWDALTIWIKSKSTWSNRRGLQISLRNAGVVVSTQTLTIERSGTWGFVSSNTTDWQLVSIPLQQFAVPAGTTFDIVRIADFGGAINFYLDDIELVKGASTGTGGGLTREEADARYLQIADGVQGPASSVDGEIVLFDSTTGKLIKRATGSGFVKATSGVYSAGTITGSIEFVIDGGGSAITTGIKGDLEIPFACTITAVRMFADQTGSIVVDIWKDAYANFPPTDADSITASAVPTISAADKSQDTTLTGWTTSVSAGDTLRFNVDSASTVTRVTVSLTFTRSA